MAGQTQMCALDERTWEQAAEQHERAVELLLSGDLEQAEMEVVAARASLERVLGDDHPDCANALATLALIREGRGHMTEALALGQRALVIFDAYRDEPIVDPLRARALASHGYRLALVGRYVEAEDSSREALALAAKDDLAQAEAWANLGVSLRLAGRHDDAAEAYGNARDLYGAQGEAIPAALHHNLAGLAFARGDHALAELHAREALAVRARDGGEGSFEFGMDLCGLGDALAGLQRFAEAEAAYREGLSCYARAGRGEHVEVAFALHNLGDVLAESSRGPEAERCYERALELKERLLGADCHELAATTINLSVVYVESGRQPQASELATRALELVGGLPADHPVRRGVEVSASSILRAS